MAVFLIQKNGSNLVRPKLMHLLYLADRESMSRYGAPISGDRMASGIRGPFLIGTLALMAAPASATPNGWTSLIVDKGRFGLSLKVDGTSDDLHELSEADVEVLGSTWLGTGHKGRRELRDFVCGQCPEWTPPCADGAALPISYAAIFRALGYADADAVESDARIEAQHSIDDRLNQLGQASKEASGRAY